MGWEGRGKSEDHLSNQQFHSANILKLCMGLYKFLRGFEWAYKRKGGGRGAGVKVTYWNKSGCSTI